MRNNCSQEWQTEKNAYAVSTEYQILVSYHFSVVKDLSSFKRSQESSLLCKDFRFQNVRKYAVGQANL